MEKVISEDIGAFYQHYPRVAVVVTAAAGSREDAMTAAWHTAVSREPALYCVAVSAGHFTYSLIAQSKEFGVNFLPDNKAELVAAIRGAVAGQPSLSPEAARVLLQNFKQPAPHYDLTERELEILALLVDGLPNGEIAAKLVVSQSTVKFHVSNILSKLGVTTRTEAVAFALKNGLIKK